jgi:hypothetical protein
MKREIKLGYDAGAMFFDGEVSISQKYNNHSYDVVTLSSSEFLTLAAHVLVYVVYRRIRWVWGG